MVVFGNVKVMETVDSKKEPSIHGSNFVVSLFLKFEIAQAVLFFAEDFTDIALTLGVAVAVVNQFTEMIYLKKKKQGQRIFVLFKSLLAVLCLFLAASSIHAQFFHHRQGETKIDFYNVFLLAKVIGFLFIFLGAVRLSAVSCDWLINRKRAAQNLKQSTPD
jgi:uncharacterized membrane protein